MQAICAFVAILSATAIFILLHWSEAQLKLPAWESLFQMDQLIGTVFVFVGMKIVHELSHGMACKHFGGECNEIGIVFYALTPSLYCDVSDSWMIVNKWHRASVAAAGVGAELVMATTALWIWWLSHPGLLHDLAFQALLIGTVSTVLVNANPLMRFDGYFVLSDLLEVPNLWLRARRTVESFFSAIFFADKSRESLEETRLRKTILLLYGMASMVYRTILTGMVLWFLYQLCFQWKMELLGVGLVSVMAFSFTAHYGLRLRSFFASGGRHRKLRVGRTLLVGLLGVAAVSIFLLAPLPKSVQAKVVFHFADTEKIIASVEGRLERVLPEGTTVVQGDEIAVLTSPSLQLQCSVRRGELARLQAKLDGLEALRNRDPSASAWIPATEESIAGLREELAQLESKSAQLRVRSPRAGIIVAGATKPMADTVEGIETWSGSLLHSSNTGCFVPAGTQICLVGPCQELEAFALINSSDVELVAAGQTVRLRSHQIPGKTLQGTVSEVGQWSRKESAKLDQMKGSRGDLFPADWIRDSAEQVLYVVRVQIDGPDDLLLEQAHGIATIAVAPQTLFSRLARLFHSTFSFEPRAQGRQLRQ